MLSMIFAVIISKTDLRLFLGVDFFLFFFCFGFPFCNFFRSRFLKFISF